MFTNRKSAGIDTFVCAVPLYVAETPKTSIKEHEPTFPVIPFGTVARAFVGHHSRNSCISKTSGHQYGQFQIFWLPGQPGVILVDLSRDVYSVRKQTSF